MADAAVSGDVIPGSPAVGAPPPKRARLSDGAAVSTEEDALRSELAAVKAQLAERDAALAEARRLLEARGGGIAAASGVAAAAAATPQLLLATNRGDESDSGSSSPRDDASDSEDALIDAVSERSVDMFKVPKERLTRRVCLEFVRANGANLQWVPRSVRGTAFDRAAIMLDAWAFGYLDRGDKTEALLIDAVRESQFFDPAMLGEKWAVPDALFTRTVVDASIVAHGREYTLEWVRKRDPCWV